MQRVIAGLFILVGIIHLLPVTGVLGAERLAVLYGLTFQEPNITILMRHRALLFGLLGLFLIYAAFQPLIQPLAFIAGFISVISFIAIAWSIGEYNEAIRRIVIADLVAAFCLVVAAALYFLARSRS